MESFKGNVTTIGSLFGKEDQVKQELTNINNNIASLKEKANANNTKALITLTTGGKVTAMDQRQDLG